MPPSRLAVRPGKLTPSASLRRGANLDSPLRGVRANAAGMKLDGQNRRKAGTVRKSI